MLVGFRVQVRPAGETDNVMVTVPVKPLTGATVMVELPAAPAVDCTLAGLVVMLKSDWDTLLLKVAV